MHLIHKNEDAAITFDLKVIITARTLTAAYELPLRYCKS